jgi:hypothetical protein
MSMQNIIYKILKIPVSKLRIYFSKLSHDSLENVLIYVLGRLKWSDEFTVEMINMYSEILDKFRNRPNVLKDAKARSKDLVKNQKIIQIALKEMELQHIKLFGDSVILDTKEKALDSQLQAHKQKLKAKGDPFADLL